MGLLFAQMISILLDGGINTFILSSIHFGEAKNVEMKIYKGVIIRIYLSSLVLPLLLIYIISSSVDTIEIILFIGAFVSGVLLSINETYFTYLKSREEYFDEMLIVAVQSVMAFIFSFFAYYFSSSDSIFICIVFILLSFLFPRIAVLYKILKDFYCERKIKIKFISLVFDYYRDLRHYSIDAILANLNLMVDSILVTLILGKFQYAIYQPLSKFLGATSGLAVVVGGYFIPRSSNEKNKSKKLILLAVPFFCFGLVISILFFFTVSPAISLLFPDNFSVSQKTIFFLSILLVLRYVNAGCSSFLTVTGNQKKRAMLNLFLLPVCVVGAMIYAKSVDGVIIAIILSQTLGLIILGYLSINLSLKDR